MIKEILMFLGGKADKTVIEVSQDDPVIVENNTEKRMIDGVITDTTLTIQLPNDTQKLWLEYDTEFVGSVIFNTGNSIIGVGTVNIPSTVISGPDTQKVVYKGEDITVSNDEYVFTPVANKRYCFMYWWDGEYMVCEVTAYEIPTV